MAVLELLWGFGLGIRTECCVVSFSKALMTDGILGWRFVLLMRTLATTRALLRRGSQLQ